MSEPVEILDSTNASVQPLLSGFAEALTNRRSDLLLRYGTNLLTRFPNSLGDKLWVVMEQVLILAIEYRQRKWVLYCIERFTTDFPSSNIVKRLSAAAFEAMGQYDEALREYQSILSTSPEDVATRRRVVALSKSQGNISEAIELLVKHLEEYQCDVESWHELGKLYISECSLSKARFCFEELILHDPRKLYNVLSFAEISASLGDDETAIKYYCLALTFEKDCTRALWGILMLHDSALMHKGTKLKSSSLQALAEVAKKRLTSIYSKFENKTAASALGLLGDLG